MATNFICSDPLTASNFNASRAFAEAAVKCFSKPFLHLCNWTLHHETLFLCVSNTSLLLSLQVPSTYHLQALMSESRLQPEGLPHIQGIFHFTPPFIMLSQEWYWDLQFFASGCTLGLCGANTQEVPVTLIDWDGNFFPALSVGLFFALSTAIF